MRPEFKDSSISSTFPSCELGLFTSAIVTYNERQRLPVVESDRHSVPVCEVSESEAAMKSSHHMPSPASDQRRGATCTVETRAERLARIKQEIQDGTYDTDEKLELAIERMIGRWRDVE
jgi:hypothetical protein